MIPWSKYHLISTSCYYYNTLFVIFKHKYIYIHSFLSVFTRKFIIFLFLTLIYCQIFRLDFFLFSCLFYHFSIYLYIPNTKSDKRRHLQMMIKTLFLLSFLFFIYSFIGWILEVVQSAFHQKRLVNRGFYQYSPLCIPMESELSLLRSIRIR